MDIYRRLASGRMSELFGNSTIETDIMFRELGLNRAARKAISHLSIDAIDSI
jgi:penicillin amidase